MAWSMLEAINQHRKAMTAKELGLILNLSSDTLYRMVKRNDIPSIVMAGTIRFDPRTVSIWLSRKDPVLAKAVRS